MTQNEAPWWRTAAVYQIYIRSFADANGDGTGDVNGLRSRLGYLRDLGVDAIWINPWYRSPLLDGGYDVADYREIEPRYGTLADAEALITDAAAHGIRVLVDLVPNHCSWDHVWFVEARTAPRGSAARDRFHIRPGTGPDGAEPPTDWKSVFGGPAWSRLDDGDWYLHLFNESQPDLNWENPEVRAEFVSILRFWLDRGAAGFRVDVAHGLVKNMAFPDEGGNQPILTNAKGVDHPFWDRDGVHDIIREWRAVLDEYDDTMMVAEAWVTPERLPLYLRPDEYHQSFNFDFLTTGWVADDLHAVASTAIEAAAAVGSAPTWVLSNHDVVRHATRLGLPAQTNWRSWLLDGPHDALDTALGEQRARAAAMFMMALPGSVYLYQGEELGLHEVHDLPEDVLDDPVWEQSGHTMKGRDGCRVPIPWTPDGPSFGFGDGEPWLPQPAGFGPSSAGAQAGVAGSMLEHYRHLLAVRREHLQGDESIEWLSAPDGVLGLRRGSGVECWLNVSGDAFDLPEGGEILASSSQTPSTTLATNHALWRMSH